MDLSIANPRLSQAALDYARGGVSVFPVRPGGKVPFGSLARHGCRDASADPERVVWWWKLKPRANIGIATGAVNGLAAIDVDPRHGGELDADWPETLTARTPGGGWHLYYRVTEPISSSAGKLAPGVDVRGDGGYVVAPPSQLDGGGAYRWVEPPATVGVLDGLATVGAALLTPEGAAGRCRGDSGGRVPAGWRPFEPAERVAKGGRNAYLASAAGWLFSQGYDEMDTERWIAEHNLDVCEPPLAACEVGRIVASIGRYHR